MDLKKQEARILNFARSFLKPLKQKQLENGSWVNESPRWLEGDAVLVTGYALLSLSYCRE